MDANNKVAIIGVGCRFPGGCDSGDKFWDFLMNSGNGVINAPEDRFCPELIGKKEQPARIVNHRGGYIDNLDKFDSLEFSIGGTEAAAMSLGQRILLEVTEQALYDSGIAYQGSNTGVFIGDHGSTGTETAIEDVGPYEMTGTSGSISANRVSYVFDLKGPSIITDTACSSSLTAMHFALSAIASGDCEQAVIAGINILISIQSYVGFSQLGVLSPEGISRPFDANANGYVRGEGGGAVVVKPLDKALADGDHIYAVIAGSAQNNCGRGPSLTYPGGKRQQEAIRTAFRRAGRSPSDVAYAELHATSTPVGDPIEANSAGELFAEGRAPEAPDTLIGSVKSNLGHLELAAGIAGLIKVALMMDKRTIVPSINMNSPNPAINWSKNRLQVATNVQPLEPVAADGKIVACVSSFGFGGSNCNLVLEEAPIKTSISSDSKFEASGDALQLFATGGMSSRATEERQHELKELANGTDIESDRVALWSIKRAKIYKWRSFAVAKSIESAEFCTPILSQAESNPICFVFSGQGPQHQVMGSSLYSRLACFRESIDLSNKIIMQLSGKNFIETYGIFDSSITEPKVPASEWPIEKTVVSITMLQMALFDTWVAIMGKQPHAVLGHSVGEIAMLYASGAVTREVALQIAIGRSAAMAVVDDTGGSMAALGCTAGDAEKLINEVRSNSGSENVQLWIAAYNSPESVTIAGTTTNIQAIVDLASQRGLFARVLRVKSAFHTELMEPCRVSYMKALEEAFQANIAAGKTGQPVIPVISTVTGNAWSMSEAFTPDYCWKNLRLPVQFASAVSSGKLSEYTIVEISAHPVLAANLSQCGVSADRVLPSLRRPDRGTEGNAALEGQLKGFLQSVGRMMTSGYNINAHVLTNTVGVNMPPLPVKPYPYQKRTVWSESTEGKWKRLYKAKKNVLTDRRLQLSVASHPWVADHAIDGVSVIPAACYIVQALGLPGGVRVLSNVKFMKALVVLPTERVTVEVGYEQWTKQWWIKTSTQLQQQRIEVAAAQFDTFHSTGNLSTSSPDPAGETLFIDVKDIMNRCTVYKTGKAFYVQSHHFIQFGDRFRNVNEYFISEDHYLGAWRLSVPDEWREELLKPTPGMAAHPAVIDAIIQMAVQVGGDFEDETGESSPPTVRVLPSGMDRFIRYDITEDDDSATIKPIDMYSKPMLVVAEVRSDKWQCYDIKVVVEETGQVILAMEGLQMGLVHAEQKQDELTNFAMDWVPTNLSVPTSILDIPTQVNDANAPSLAAFEFADAICVDYLDKYSDAIKSISSENTELSIDRQRYIDFCSRTLANYNGRRLASFSDAESIDLRQEFQYMDQALDRIGNVLVDVCRDSKAAISTLFSDDLMTNVYQSAPMVTPLAHTCADALRKGLIAAKKSGKKIVRILELGTGTGGLTVVLDPILVEAAEMGIHVELVTSDVTRSLAADTLAKLKHTVVHNALFDVCEPTWDGSDFGAVHRRSFDFVVALYVVHAAKDIHSAMETVYEALVPGGHAMIIELDGAPFQSRSVPGTIMMDFLFGSTREWFGAEDSIRCLPDREWKHCTLSSKEWTTIANSCGFDSQSIQYLTMQYAPFSMLMSMQRPDKIWPPALEMSAESYLQGIDTSSDILFEYVDGSEMDLVSIVKDNRSNDNMFLLVYATNDDVGAKASGLSRVLRNELLDWKVVLVLFAADVTATERKNWVARFHHEKAKSLDYEYLVSASGTVSVMRVVQENVPEETVSGASDMSTPWSLHILDKSAGIESLGRQRKFLPELDSNDVEVILDAVGLTRRNIDLETGVLGRDVENDLIDFVGHIAKVGESVSKFQVGDRVMGVAYQTPGNMVTTNQSSIVAVANDSTDAGSLKKCWRSVRGVLKKTKKKHRKMRAWMGRMPDETAASFPIAYSASWKALVNCGNISQGDNVLIHTGCSSIGIAAIQIAKRKGANVFATVETEAQRRYLQDVMHLEPNAISDCNKSVTWTRDLSRWSPAGVDVVINSLSGEHLIEGLRCLKVGGHFVDLSTRNTNRDSSVGISTLASNRSMHTIDLSQPQVVSKALSEVAAEHFLRPFDLSHLTAMPWTQASQAYVALQAPEQIGKVVLTDLSKPSSSLKTPRGSPATNAMTMAPSTKLFDPRKAYVLIGGVGGIGSGMVQWLAEEGAKHIVLTSRSGIKTYNALPGFAKQSIRNQTALHNLKIKIVAADSTDLGSMRRVFNELPAPLGGVFLLSGVLRDGVFSDATQQDFIDVYAPKIEALKVLEKSVNFKTLDFAVLFSSGGVVVGNPGQANYTAANCYLEQRAKELPNTLAVSVPAISDMGFYARMLQNDKSKRRGAGDSGIIAVHCMEFCRQLGIALRRKLKLYLSNMEWNSASRRFRLHRLTSHLVAKEISSGVRGGDAANSADGIDAVVKQLLGLHADDELDPDVPLTSYGLDSISAVQLKSLLSQLFGVKVTQMQLLGNVGTGFLKKAAEGGDANESEENQASTESDDVYGDVLIPLQQGVSPEDEPLYLIHGIGGGVTMLKELASRLECDVIGVDCGRYAPLDDGMMGLVEFYADALESTSTNSFRIGGFSMGGLIAVLVCLVLQQRGRDVSSVVLIDVGVDFGTAANDSIDRMMEIAITGLEEAGFITSTMCESMIQEFKQTFVPANHGEPRSFAENFKKHYEIINREDFSMDPMDYVDASQLTIPFLAIRANQPLKCTGLEQAQVMEGIKEMYSNLDKLNNFRQVYIDDNHFHVIRNEETAAVINEFYRNT